MKIVIIIIVLAIISIIAIWVIPPTIFLEPDRTDTFPKNPIWFTSSPNVISNVDFHINTNTGKSNHQIWFEYDVQFLNATEPGFIAFVLPYHGSLTTDEEWYVYSNNEGTAFVKEFVCSELLCDFNDKQDFVFELDRKIDFKQSYHHSLNFKFENYFGSGELADFILKFDKHPNIHKNGFQEMKDPTITVVLDKTADNIVTVPDAIPDSFSNKNKQRIWPIQTGVAYEIDFQIPAERKAQDDFFFISTVVSLVLAIAGIVFPSLISLRKPSISTERHKQEFDLRFKPLIELGEPKPLFGVTDKNVRFHWGDVEGGLIPISIWDFGIIYEVEVTNDKKIPASISIKKTTSKNNITQKDFLGISENENQIITSKKSHKIKIRTPIIFTKDLDLEKNPYFLGIEIQHKYMDKIEKIVKVWKISSINPSVESEWRGT